MQQSGESSGKKKRSRYKVNSSDAQVQKIVEERPFVERCAHCKFLVASSTLNYLRGAMIKHVQKCKKARGINPEDERDDEEFEAMQGGGCDGG